MSQEPVILPTDDLDAIEDVLDALADGYGIKPPGEKEQTEYREALENIRDARP